MDEVVALLLVHVAFLAAVFIVSAVVGWWAADRFYAWLKRRLGL